MQVRFYSNTLSVVKVSITITIVAFTAFSIDSRFLH